MTKVDFLRDVLLFAALGACSSGGTDAPPPPRDAAPEVTPDVPVDEPAPPEDVRPEDVPPEASGIGDACESDEDFGQGDCASGQICLTPRIGFRNGYCVQSCIGGASCPADAVCVRLQGFPVCLRRCAVGTDCRTGDGYVCGIGDNSTQRVCRVNDEPVGRRPDGTSCYTTTAGPHMLPALPRRVFTGANFSVSALRRDAFATAEGNIAVHPMSGNVVSTYIGSGSAGGSFMGVSASSNMGTNWEWANVVDPLGGASDPVVDFGRDGTVRMTFIGLARTGAGSVSQSHIRVTESTDSGRTWAAPRQVDIGNTCNNGGICDKPWILTGPGLTAGAESVYIAYRPNTRSTVDMVVQRSDDGGRTWTPAVTIGRAQLTGINPTTPNLVELAVGRPGEVAATWIALSAGMGSGEEGAARFGSPGNRVFLRRTVDGFRTTESSHVVSSAQHSPVYEQPPVGIDGDVLHVAFSSGNATGAWDIILATSADHGETWRYRKVNDEPDSCATHAFASMVVDTVTHAVHLTWLENRFGDGAAVYARCPGDPAMPCGANEALSNASFRFTTGRSPMVWHGDYQGLTLTPSGDLWATWSDTRTGRPAMYVARGRAR